MRIVSSKLEYIIFCPCSMKIAYVEKEIGQVARCPMCGSHHDLNGTHETYMLEKCNIAYPADRRIEQ